MTPLGQVAYEAYCAKTGWKSLATGADLPRWEKLNVDIQEAWQFAAESVVAYMRPTDGQKD